MSGDREELEFGPYRLATAFLAMLPLFVAYELGVGGGGPRNSAELFAGRLFELFGAHAALVRWIALGAASVLAFAFALAERGVDEDSFARLFARQLGEGLVAALCLGPLLVAALSVFGVSLAELMAPVSSTARGVGAPPPLSLLARIMGGAAWEELVFRLAAYGVLFLATVRLVHFFGAKATDAAPAGDLVAILGSSLLFAAFHLDLLTRLFGDGGEPFDRGIFLWRLLAGLCLAGLFRWRGLAVAAWAHALFNAALLLGVAPDVFSAG